MRFYPVLLGLLLLFPTESASQTGLPVEVRLRMEQGRIAVANMQFADALMRYEEAITILGEPLEDIALLAAEAAHRAGNLDKAVYYIGLVINSNDAEFRASNDYQRGIRVAAEIDLEVKRRQAEQLAAAQADEQRRQAEERQREAQQRADMAAFQRASTAGTEQAYAEYLSSYPQGARRQEAQQELTRLRGIRSRQEEIAQLNAQIANARSLASEARGRGTSSTLWGIFWLGVGGGIVYSDLNAENGLAGEYFYEEEDIPEEGLEDYERYSGSVLGGLIGIVGLQSVKAAFGHFQDAGRFSTQADELEQRVQSMRVSLHPTVDPLRQSAGVVMSLRF